MRKKPKSVIKENTLASTFEDMKKATTVDAAQKPFSVSKLFSTEASVSSSRCDDDELAKQYDDASDVDLDELQENGELIVPQSSIKYLPSPTVPTLFDSIKELFPEMLNENWITIACRYDGKTFSYCPIQDFPYTPQGEDVDRIRLINFKN